MLGHASLTAILLLRVKHAQHIFISWLSLLVACWLHTWAGLAIA
jgi:hypothetical protein